MQTLKRLARLPFASNRTPTASVSDSLYSLVNIRNEQVASDSPPDTTSSCHFRIVLPGIVRKLYDIPSSVQQPYYLNRSIDVRKANERQVHSEEMALDGMRESGALARHVLQIVANSLEEGMTTEEIDLIVFNEVVRCGAYPSPLGYKGYPKSCCTSINNVVCHGIPDDTKLRNSDIINVDVTVFLDGFHGDTSHTFVIGQQLDQTGRDLVKVCEECVNEGIQACKVGNTVHDVQKAFHGKLNEFLKENEGYKFVFDSHFSSHGIGSEFHTAPNLHSKLGSGDIKHVLVEGQTLTVEPILLERDSPVATLRDNWTCTSTIPLSRSAQFEHTVLVTSNGPEILT